MIWHDIYNKALIVKLNLKNEFKNVQENEKSCKKTID